MIVDALHEVGAARSIVIDEHGRVLAGNATIEAAAQAGIERVQVVDADGETLVAVRRTGLTEAQKTRLALYDNRTAELADWDPEALATIMADDGALEGLFQDWELEDILGDLLKPEMAEDPGAQVDKAAELQEKWRVERGQVWQIGAHRLMCGDSTSAEDVARLMGGEKPRLMVTDPPYGVEYDASWRDEAARAGLLQFGAARQGAVRHDDRVDWKAAMDLFPGHVIYCWHADLHASKVAAYLEAAGFEIRCQIIWNKPHFVIGRGHYHTRHEPCWYAFRRGQSAEWIGGRDQDTVWNITLDKNVVGGHSTQKPVECMARPIRNHAGDVYDPFLGSGTTLVACEQLGRRGFGMEICEKYVAVTLERLAGMGLNPILTNQ